MRIGRLRLVGFKSFADAAELTIEPGLTGVVGPNGCGKSNLVEALRWVMGEASARRLRGGEMDDVIFGGATGRPARNIAEVVLTIDNTARDMPRQFDDRDEIEIGRRLERGGGSAYRVNGREVRARDVQLLFADAASGGQSWAIVGQGRVGALIDAKPADRRLLLEEAAGTAALQVRRREAENKLQAAQENLGRLDEVAAMATGRLGALQKQARQAKRYRRLAEQIRRCEALLLHARWHSAQAVVTDAFDRLRQAETIVAETTGVAAVRQRAYENAEAAMPLLRDDAAEAEAQLKRLSDLRNGLEQDFRRLQAAGSDAERRCRELTGDLRREDTRGADAAAALARLSKERRTLIGAEAAGEASAVAKARQRAAAERAAAAETSLRQATEAAAHAAARRAACLRRRRELGERLAQLRVRAAETEGQRAILAGTAAPFSALAAAREAVAGAERLLAHASADVKSAERESAGCRASEAAALDRLRPVEIQLARLIAEVAALQALLVPVPQPIGGTPIVAGLRVADGFEVAIGAIFDDELAAPVDSGEGAGESCYWVELPAFDSAPPLPEGARPLAEGVVAPLALGRSLAHAGWVEDEATGRRLQSRLMPGQRLVDRDGRLWRWDGFTRIAATRSTAAQQLLHKRRLTVLSGEISQAEATARSTRALSDDARAAARRAAAADSSARARLRQAEAALADARVIETELARRALTTETRLSVLVDAAGRLAGELGEVQAQARENERDLAAFPEPGPVQAALDAARAQAAKARRHEAEAQTEIELLTQRARSQAGRLAALDAEESAWRDQASGATAQRAALVGRHRELEQEISALAARSAMIAAESEAFAIRISDAAASARRSAGAVALGETRTREAAEGRYIADRAMAHAREQHARLEATHGAACETLARLVREIDERLAVEPEALGAIADLACGEGAAQVAETTVRLERLRRERDGIGPVNLVAESEAAEIEAQVSTIRREQAELTEAVARLRSGIATLDQEARRRMAEAFERVNGHFAELFVRLFGGGKAQLSLTDPFNPLAAGLEIMASPAGKRLQMLSLLSGGEQALTALALIFAFFLTNPAPVCILDEVDAPLDDANVERLCGLVAEIAERTHTRFLLITHHRITMSRVDRLFGVTMPQPGVSQLVSVDLARADRLRQTA